MSLSIPSFTLRCVEQPQVLERVSAILRVPRNSYSTDFAGFILHESDSESYKTGLILLSCLIGFILFLWLVILISLKIKGESTGCASGQAFECEIYRGPANIKERNSGSTEYDHESSRDIGQATISADSSVSGENDNASFQSSISSSEVLQQQHMGTVDDELCTVSSEESSLPSVRERRTQLVYLFFAVTTIALAPLTFFAVFLPLQETSNSFDSYNADVRDILSEAQSSALAISMAIKNAEQVYQSTPTTFKDVCPVIDQSLASASLGFDLVEMVDLFRGSYESLHTELSSDFSNINTMLSGINDIVDFIESSIIEPVNQYSWFIPGALLGIVSLTFVTILGVYMSWRRKSNLAFQRLLSYGILPFLFVFSMACWIVAIATAITTSIADDACTQGSSNGSPAISLSSMLDYEKIPDDALYRQFLITYTSACQEGNATQVLVEINSNVKNLLDLIWTSLSSVNSITAAVEACNSTNVETFLFGARDLAKLLTTVKKAIDSITISLRCDRISPLYVAAVNDSLCTDVARLSARGFLLFWFIGITSMCLVSLRASWRHEVAEDKIFDDEQEEAENMILDEHEEYLAYISKYKHEWEEYRGIDNIPPKRSSILDLACDDDSQESETMRDIDETQAFDPYHYVSQSPSTDISFISLSDLQPKAEESELCDGVETVRPSLLEESGREIEEKIEMSLQPQIPRSSSDGRDIASALHDEGCTNFEKGLSVMESSSILDGPTGSLGNPVVLSIPPGFHRSESHAVQFCVEELPSTLVGERIARLSKPRASLPLTPTRTQPEHIKDLVARFDNQGKTTSKSLES